MDVVRVVEVPAAVQVAEGHLVALTRPGEPADRVRRRLLRDGELDRPAARVAEAHLQLALDRQEADLVGDVGEEEHRRRTRRDVRQVGVELAADAQAVVEEVQQADDQELAVGRELHDHLAVEERLARVDVEDPRRAGDRHRRREGRGEAAHARVLAQEPRLRRDLGLQRREPLVRRDGARRLEVAARAAARVVDRRQRLEELDAREEVVDRKAERRVDDDRRREVRLERNGQRAELREADADRDAADAGEREAALEPRIEDALVDRRDGVEVVDDTAAGVELEDAAHELGVDLAAEHVALDRDAERADADDRELAVDELPDVDLDALDRARELEAGDPVDALDARGEDEGEVRRVGADVRPRDPDRVDVDRQPARPLEAVAARAADAQEDAEARLRVERPVAEEGEVPRLAADRDAADVHGRADRGEADELVVRPCARVEVEVLRGEGQERAELDVQRVDVELQRLEVAVREFDRCAERLGVRVGAVADRAVDGLAGQEADAAGGEVEAAAERVVVERRVAARVERDAEAGQTDAEVVELEQPEQADRRPVGLADDQRGVAELEPVGANGEARDHVEAGARRARSAR